MMETHYTSRLSVIFDLMGYASQESLLYMVVICSSDIWVIGPYLYGNGEDSQDTL